MTRHPTLAYVFLRNSTFGPNGAAAVELCVRDLIRHSRFAASTLVVCPKVDEPFEGVAIETVPDAGFGGNLGKAWAVGRLLKRRGVEVAVVENHLPAAAVVAAASGLPVILHSHAYEKAAHGALKRAERAFELNRLAGLAFCSEDCLARFRINFPGATAPMRAIPNGLDMREWSSAGVKDKLILSVGRGIDDKGHREAMAAVARTLRTRPDWSARFILSAVDREPETVRALRAAAAPFGERVRIDANLPYAEVKRAWARASVGMALTKSPEPFGRTALEALASGAALVASGLGGLAEVCGRDALTVDPVDPEAVAAALAALVDAPDVRETLARAGRARVEALYDMGVVAGRMDDFLEEALRRRAG
ncbi:glycosyltransferase involved in cell wall biosynthesis [Roseiarcus fermentans]|uniref:Glycosyltransferase involved in cell wall biosynthesis n=1 Tax=Roseiarcus fermentans TaxID=1473586 RepID=A0A366FDY2_9HYPH|nr:glycosyltransferase family 4 protein [Roseiarcus fermentans]RBP12821.1 glycosyltransferase involved in cell wall biosynthesis [Roseiarcus fermentans]